MNQIPLGDSAGIDTNEPQGWERRDGEDPRWRVQFKNGNEMIIRGEAMEAFGEWVSLIEQREIREAPGSSVEQLTAMAYKQGVRAGREETISYKEQIVESIYRRIMAKDGERDDPWPAKSDWRKWLRWCLGAAEPEPTSSCQSCVYHDWKIGPCQSPDGPETFPDCYEGGGGPEAPGPWPYPKCLSCVRYFDDTGLCQRGYPRAEYPGCFETREQPIENMGGPHSVAKCKLCADYNPATDHCTRKDTTKSWPDCWREREADEESMADILSALCDGCDDIERDSGGACGRRNSAILSYPECHSRYAGREPRQVQSWQTIFTSCPLCDGNLELTIKPRVAEAVQKSEDGERHSHQHCHGSGHAFQQHYHEHSWVGHHDA